VEDPVLECAPRHDVPEVGSNRPALRRQAIGQLSMDVRLLLRSGAVLLQAGVPLTGFVAATGTVEKFFVLFPFDQHRSNG